MIINSEDLKKWLKCCLKSQEEEIERWKYTINSHVADYLEGKSFMTRQILNRIAETEYVLPSNTQELQGKKPKAP